MLVQIIDVYDRRHYVDSDDLDNLQRYVTQVPMRTKNARKHLDLSTSLRHLLRIEAVTIHRENIKRRMCSLHVLSLHDVEAECACGRWHFMRIGPATAKEVRAEWAKHFQRV